MKWWNCGREQLEIGMKTPLEDWRRSVTEKENGGMKKRV